MPALYSEIPDACRGHKPAQKFKSLQKTPGEQKSVSIVLFQCLAVVSVSHNSCRYRSRYRFLPLLPIALPPFPSFLLLHRNSLWPVYEFPFTFAAPGIGSVVLLTSFSISVQDSAKIYLAPLSGFFPYASLHYSLCLILFNFVKTHGRCYAKCSFITQRLTCCGWLCSGPGAFLPLYPVLFTSS